MSLNYYFRAENGGATRFEWTDERIERLKVLHGWGWASSNIANELGCTRNAALGKIHRLGLSKPMSKGEKSARVLAKEERRKPVLKFHPKPVSSVVPKPAAEPVTNAPWLGSD